MAAVALACLSAQLVLMVMPVESLSLVFLPAVLVAAARYGLAPSIFASVLAFFAYNFFFTEPFYTFDVYNESEFLTLVLFLVVSIVTGNLAARLRMQASAQRAVAERTSGSTNSAGRSPARPRWTTSSGPPSIMSPRR